MGTRSTIQFIERFDGEEEGTHNDAVLAAIYQQFDGYPDSVGLDLFNFLNGMTVVNGISSDTPTRAANGVGCLAAQFIAEMKSDIGGFYMTTPDDSQEYNYRVIFTFEGEGWNSKPVISKITCNSWSGTLEEFGKFCDGGYEDWEEEE